VEAGDAVYLGLPRFNARERAENFSLADLCRVLPHARARGVRVYLAMNTLLTEKDLPEAMTWLHQVEPLRPDAVIAADLGLVRIVREFYPALPVHVSTQAGCASALAAEVFARLGASRVILERHLRFEEVRRIAARSPIEVEIFVHGSMCFCFSGKCLFSSFLGGKSANRGACVQPCRRVYAFAGGEGAVFSARDLSLIERLPDLVPLGIAGFKIEGRMRGADYVSAVVAAYRTALDAIRDGRPREGIEEGKRLLASAAGREATPGLVGGAKAQEVAAGGPTGNVGELLGTIRAVREGWAEVAGMPALRRGDRLRVQFAADGSGRGFTALSVRSGPNGVLVRVPFPVAPGDLLLRTGGGERVGLARRARRTMEALPPGGVDVRVAVEREAVRVEAAYGTVRRGYSFRVAGAAPPAEGIPPDGAERLRVLYRGDLPLGRIVVEEAGGRVPWHDVEVLFARAARQFDKEFYLAGKQRRVAVLPALRVAGERREARPSVFFACCFPRQLERLPRDPAVVPVVEFTRTLARDPARLPAGWREALWLRLPAPLLEGDTAFWRRAVREAASRGLRRLVLSDAGHFGLLRAAGVARGALIMTDHMLPGLNTGALSVLSRLGASRMVLPAEAPLEALRAVAPFLRGLGVPWAYGALPLMTSRLLPAQGARDAVRSPRGETFSVEVDERGSTVRPGEPFSASGILHELRAAGFHDFFVDLRGTPDEAIPRVFEALFADRPIPGTSSFNLFRTNF